MSIQFSRVIFIVPILLYTGCSSTSREEPISTPTHLVISSTLPTTSTTVPSETATRLPGSPTASLASVEGITSTQVNVRAEPSTASQVLGMIPANTRVEITGKDPGEGWWQINYPQGVDGKGWVAAQYITTTTTPDVPSIDNAGAEVNNGNIAIVQQQLNVRSGPGTDFNSLGMLNPQDVLRLIGKDANGVWLQIDFAGGPEGKGWVNAAFVQASGVENLPIVTETGRIIGTGTPTGIPFTPTPTIIPAWEDQDTASNPIASVVLEPTGTRAFIYSGDLSSPQGDTEDWIEFRPYGSFVFASLACKGSGLLDVEITENNLPVNLNLACGDPMKQVPVKANASYLVHLQAEPGTGTLQSTNYILTIRTRLE